MYTNSKLSASLALASLVYNFIFPQYAWANYEIDLALDQEEIKLSPVDGLITLQGQALVQSTNPDTPVVVAQYWVTVTAYSSTPDQTDSTPFITASGTYVRDGVIACNFLRFGTRVRFPQLYGEKIFVVEDRMAPKNSYKMDIWFATRDQAKQFGVKWTKVEILET
jgi:3D (Asp-Asp-Asp) domain-containing protein